MMRISTTVIHNSFWPYIFLSKIYNNPKLFLGRNKVSLHLKIIILGYNRLCFEINN